jgi:hypothetical protein
VVALATVGVWSVFGETPALKAPFCIHGYFYPSGFMGDTQQIVVTDPWKGDCHSGPTCIKVTYKPGGAKGWAGVYWQYPTGNWGDNPGRKIEGAKRVVFWVRGQNGGETVDFKAGGISGKYRDSFERPTSTKALTATWERFEIDLSGADTSSVIGAFNWSTAASANPEGLTFYLDGICYE